MALRDLVKDVHDRAENSPFAKLLMSGEIPEQQYANYLYQQKLMYRGLENHADDLGILKDIPHIKRHEKISDDLDSIKCIKDFRIYDITQEYVDYVKTIDEQQCWAHIYVRHFGDMYGGNMISKRIPYGLHSMYQFDGKKELIEYVRNKLNEDMAEEAKKVFKYATTLFIELEQEYDL